MLGLLGKGFGAFPSLMRHRMRLLSGLSFAEWRPQPGAGWLSEGRRPHDGAFRRMAFGSRKAPDIPEAEPVAELVDQRRDIGEHVFALAEGKLALGKRLDAAR